MTTPTLPRSRFGPSTRERDGVLGARERVRCFEKEQRSVRNVRIGLGRVVRVVQTDADDLRGVRRREEVNVLQFESLTPKLDGVVNPLANANTTCRITESYFSHPK